MRALLLGLVALSACSLPSYSVTQWSEQEAWKLIRNRVTVLDAERCERQRKHLQLCLNEDCVARPVITDR